MPLPSTDVPAPVRRTGRLIPLIIAFVVVVGAAIVAWTHLIAKGPAPSLQGGAVEATAPTEGRDAYTPQDYTEPNAK